MAAHRHAAIVMQDGEVGRLIAAGIDQRRAGGDSLVIAGAPLPGAAALVRSCPGRARGARHERQQRGDSASPAGLKGTATIGCGIMVLPDAIGKRTGQNELGYRASLHLGCGSNLLRCALAGQAAPSPSMNRGADMLGTAANPKAGLRRWRAGGQGECPTRGFHSFRPAFSTRPHNKPARTARAQAELAMLKNNPPRRPHLRRRADQARPVGRAAFRRGHPLPNHPRHRAQYPDRRLGHGHGDRGAYGDRHGAGRRHRRHSPQSRSGGAGGAGAPGQEIRIGHGGEPGHHSSRRDARRRADADAGEPHLRHPGGRGRRQRPRRQAGRHSHQSRRALCHRPAAKNLRADDQGRSGHGARRASARTRPNGCCTSTASRSFWWSMAIIAASA